MFRPEIALHKSNQNDKNNIKNEPPISNIPVILYHLSPTVITISPIFHHEFSWFYNSLHFYKGQFHSYTNFLRTFQPFFPSVTPCRSRDLPLSNESNSPRTISQWKFCQQSPHFIDIFSP